MNPFDRALTFLRLNWLPILIAGMMVALAILAGRLVDLKEQQANKDEAATAYAQQRSLLVSTTVSVAHPDDAQAEGTKAQYQPKPVNSAPPRLVNDTPDRVLSRASLSMATWSVWIGIFIGLIGSLIGLGQLVGTSSERGSRRNCLILQIERRAFGCHVVRLINVGGGSLSLTGIEALDATGAFSSMVGADLPPGRHLDITIVPAHGVPRPSFDLVVAGGIDGRGLTGSFEYDPVNGYILRRQVEA